MIYVANAIVGTVFAWHTDDQQLSVLSGYPNCAILQSSDASAAFFGASLPFGSTILRVNVAPAVDPVILAQGATQPGR